MFPSPQILAAHRAVHDEGGREDGEDDMFDMGLFCNVKLEHDPDDPDEPGEVKDEDNSMENINDKNMPRASIGESLAKKRGQKKGTIMQRCELCKMKFSSKDLLKNHMHSAHYITHRYYEARFFGLKDALASSGLMGKRMLCHVS